MILIIIVYDITLKNQEQSSSEFTRTSASSCSVTDRTYSLFRKKVCTVYQKKFSLQNVCVNSMC